MSQRGLWGTLGFSMLIGLAGACATSSDPSLDTLPTEPSTSSSTSSSSGGAKLPPSSAGPDDNTSNDGAGKDAGSTSKDASTSSGNDATSPPPPPPPPPPPAQVCIQAPDAGASACFAVETACGCNADCCGSLTCDKVGGLIQTQCCVKENAGCTNDDECCGQLLCKPAGDGGTKMTCQPLI